MTMLSSLKPPENNFSVNGPRDHILLGYDDDKLFETPRIKNHSVTEPSAQVLLVENESQSFETHPLKSTVSMNQVKILF